MRVDEKHDVEEFRCNVCGDTFNRVTREGAPYWEGECPYCQHTGGHLNTDYENNT